MLPDGDPTWCCYPLGSRAEPVVRITFQQEALPDVEIIYGDRIGKLGKLALSCAAVILDPTRQSVLLTRRPDNGRWCLPARAMDAGESAVECCA